MSVCMYVCMHGCMYVCTHADSQPQLACKRTNRGSQGNEEGFWRDLGGFEPPRASQGQGELQPRPFLPEWRPKMAKIEARSLAQIEVQNCQNWPRSRAQTETRSFTASANIPFPKDLLLKQKRQKTETAGTKVAKNNVPAKMPAVMRAHCGRHVAPTCLPRCLPRSVLRQACWNNMPAAMRGRHGWLS